MSDYLANLYGWVVVSLDFIELTKNIINDQVQYLPVTITDRITKVKINSYYVANIVSVVDALDLGKSKYEKNMQKYKCLCCGKETLSNKPSGTFETCSECSWETSKMKFNDLLQEYLGGNIGKEMLYSRIRQYFTGLLSGYRFRELEYLKIYPFISELQDEALYKGHILRED